MERSKNNSSPQTGDKADIKNYRPISLMSHAYMIFTRIIQNWIHEFWMKTKPKEQAGFRGGLNYRSPACFKSTDRKGKWISTGASYWIIYIHALETRYVLFCQPVVKCISTKEPYVSLVVYCKKHIRDKTRKKSISYKRHNPFMWF